MSLLTRRFSDGIKKWHPGQYDEKRFQGWKTVSKGFAERVLDSSIVIVDCYGCTLNEQGRQHILDPGMELCFEKGWRQTGETYEGVYGLQDIRLFYEADDSELVD